MNVRSRRHIRRLLPTAVWLVALLAGVHVPSLAAQTKSMTVTAVTSLDWLAYHEDDGTASYAVQFTVKNTGTQAAWILATQDCGAWCGGNPAWSGLWASLNPGQSTTVPVWLTVPDYPSTMVGVVHLTVVGSVGGTRLDPGDYATALVNLSAGTATLLAPPRPPDVVTAPNGATIALPTAWTSFSFVVSNTSSNSYVPASVSFTLRCGGFLGWVNPATAEWRSCGNYAGDNPIYNEEHPFAAIINSGHPDTIPITLYGSNGGRGYVRLIKSMVDPATAATVVDTASVLVTTGPQLMPQVTPKGTAVIGAPRYARVDSFTVRNSGTVTADYAMSADCGSFGGGGCATTVSLVTLAAGATARVGVAYTTSATNGAMSAVKLVAVGTSSGVITQRDTGSIMVTALDAVAPTIAITPAQSANITTRAFTATVNVCDDGVVGNPVVTFNGVPLPDMFLRASQTGCVTAGTSTFTLNAQPGVNALVVTDSDGYHTASATRTFSYDDATSVAPQVTGPGSLIRVTPAVVWADTFTVKNPGSVAAQYALSLTCGTFSGCNVQPSTATIAAGATVKIAAIFTTPNSGQSQIRLTASHTSATNHTVTASASFVATAITGTVTQISMSPADGAVYSGSTFTATVTWCDPDSPIVTHQVWLGGVLLPDTFVQQFVPGCVGAGTSTWTNLTLVPWDQLLLAQATDNGQHVSRVGHVVRYIPSLSAYQPQVTPKNIQTSATPGVVNSQTFQVFNAGSLAATYPLTATCGAFTVCVVDKSSLAIAPGARDSAHVTFLAPSAIGAFSPIKLVAVYMSPAGGAVADSGTVTAQTPTAFDLYQPQVHSIMPLMLVQPGAIPLLTYSIKNAGTQSVTYSVTTTMPSDYWFSSPHYPIQSVTLAPGASYVMDVQPHATSVINQTGAVIVRVAYTASDGTTVSASDSSLVTTKDGVARLKITTISARSVTLSRGYGGDVDGTFAVQNVGTYPLSVSLSTVCSELLIKCSAPLASYVDIGNIVNVGVSFRVGLSPDAGTLRLIGVSGGPQNSTTSQDSIRVHFDDFKGVSITPDSMWVSVPPGDAGKQFFRIHNDGGSPAQYRYLASCQNVTGQFFLTTQTCVDSGRTAWISPGDSAAVPVRYAATTTLAQNGFVRLDAWDLSDDRVTAHGRIFMQTDQVLPLVVSVRQAGASTTIARNQCLTIKAGDDAAYECGDLRLVHALPTTTTLSRARTPTLLYNSRDHGGVILFPADVSVSSGAQIASLVARVIVDGQLPESTTFAWNPQWNSKSTMRIVVPFHAREKGVGTGAYHYRLAVDAITGGAPLSSEDSGTVAVVNRSTSQFGPGWWLDGYEQLFFTSVANQILWVGGDGSTRLYTQVGASNVWLVKPTLDRPDSLISANGWWYRHLRNGAYVMFNASGIHAATVDSRQRVTWFNHDDPQHPSWLTSIDLPVPVGSTAVRRYTFGRDAGSAYVNWVDAPGIPARHVSLLYSVALDGSTVLNRIIDQDGAHGVLFNFLAAGRPLSRVDRRDHATSFVFDDNARSLVRSTLDMAGTAANNISLGFCSAESASLSACARGPIDTSSVVTRFDGPRLDADVLDSAWFRVTRYGAPSRITDALKNVTRIERSNPRWPLLATRTIDPVGFTTTAEYDSSRALLISSSAISPRSVVGAFASDSTATTIYKWHTKWDVVTQVQTPAKTLTQYVYDSVSGDLLSQHVGTGAKRNVVYGYDPATRLVNAVTTLVSSSPTRYHYDALGNVDTTKTPRGLASSTVRNYIGQDSVTRTPIEDLPTVNWRQQTYTYDANDRLRIATDSGKSTAPNSAMKLTVTNEYDTEGNLISITRRASPDSLGLGDVVLTSAFDAANRKTSEFDPYRGTLRSWIYDAAGNATTTVRGEDVATAEFDALNRVQHRVVPGPPNTFTPEAALDDQRFSYSARGELTRATNRYAEVRRVYNQAGAIAYDTSIVFAAALATPTGNQHVYGLAYSYDLEGRRKSLTPPASLSVVSPVSYGYDPESGDLTTLTVQNGGSFRYVYTAAGLLDSLVQADGTVERHYYDDDGRETRRTEFSLARQLMLHDEVVGLDARGRRTVVAMGGFAFAPTETYTYDGLDGVLSANGKTSESTPRDPLGNARLRVNSTEAWSERYAYEPHSTRLHDISRQLTESLRFDSLSQTHNLAGDLVRVIDQITGPQACTDGHDGHVDCPPPNRREIAQSLLQNKYDADGHLLLSVKETTNDQSGTWVPAAVRDPNWFEVYAPFERGVTEEYRYDALGRRIWVHAHRDAYCPTQRDRDSTTVCLSTIERTIYDGDQVLAEIRQPGDTSQLASVLESDGIPGGLRAAHFGQVGYVHGLGIDRPLELWRNYNGTVIRLVTHYQWQGALELGTTLTGQLIQCGLIGVTGPCEDIDWPGAKIRFGLVWPHPSLGPPSWWGTMAGMKENATGMRDMRNRQYDPRTGRFTQEDPIGLAGGMNLYGFASGDAVNFSDPLGLSPPQCPPCTGVPAGGVVGAAGGLIGLSAWAASTAEKVAEGIEAAAHSIAEAVRENRPQIHHIATDKNWVSERAGGPWSPQFEPLFEKAGVSMNGVANKTVVFGHRGPHPEQYHQAIYNSLIAATKGLDGDEYRAAFLKQLHILAVKLATPGTDLNAMVRKP